MTVLTPSPILTQEFIYQRASFVSCHASTIIETPAPNGKSVLIAAWFGGSGEGRPDTGIWMAKQIGGRWTAPREVAFPEKRLPCWNPVLFQPANGPLFLFYKIGAKVATWWGMVQTSDDGGETWSKAQRLPPGIFGPIKNKPIQLDDGRIVSPSSDEAHSWQVHFEWSIDLCRSWQRTSALNDGRSIGAIQPTILVRSRKHLQALCRTQQQRIATIESYDEGKTWGPMRLTDLPNPNSGIDAVTLRDGRFLLVYNDSATERSPIDVAISDGGEHWSKVLTLEDHARSEYSYPAVIQTSDGMVHITYTWNRARIRHVVLDPSRLR